MKSIHANVRMVQVMRMDQDCCVYWSFDGHYVCLTVNCVCGLFLALKVETLG